MTMRFILMNVVSIERCVVGGFKFRYRLLRETSLLPYRLISRGNISRFSSSFFTVRLAPIFVLNDARSLTVDFLLGSEAEALTASSSFSLLHYAAAGGGVADAWGGRCKWAWVMPIRLLHCVHVGTWLGVLAWTWAYKALGGVTLCGGCGGVAVLGGRAEWGCCAVDACCCCAGGDACTRS